MLSMTYSKENDADGTEQIQNNNSTHCDEITWFNLETAIYKYLLCDLFSVSTSLIHRL